MGGVLGARRATAARERRGDAACVMRARRVLLVTNPVARLGRRRHDVALEVMRRSGVAVDDAVTSRPGESAELLRRCATAYDAVFTLGGDGTAVEVLGAL